MKIPKKLYSEMSGGYVRMFTGQILKKNGKSAKRIIDRYTKLAFLEHL